MILPPFFGANSVYDEDDVKNVIVDYLASDIFTFVDPQATASLTYLVADVAAFDSPKSLSSVTYLSADTLSLPRLADGVALTYEAVDICTFDPPPEPPLLTNFLSTIVSDTEIEFSWDTPYNNRCPITEYILQYTDCFLSDILTEDSKSIIEEANYVSAENQDRIVSENSNQIISENAKLIGEQHRDNCTYQEYDRRKVLIENRDRLKANTQLFITEQSSGIGTVNNILVQDLINNQPHIFRIAAVNCVGTGEFSTTGILTPVGPIHKYCDIKLFMQPNSTTNVESSLIDYSCREKTINQLAAIETSTDSKFGLGSLYFNGVYDSFPNPGTYPHIRVNNNSTITGDDWSLLEDFTIEMWVRPSSSSHSDTLISAYTQGADSDDMDANSNYWRLFRTSTVLTFQAVVSELTNETGEYGEPVYNNGTLNLNYTGALPTGEYTNIAISRFNNIARLYINGELKDKKEFDKNIAITGAGYLIIGGNQGPVYDVSDTFGISRGAIQAGTQYIGYIDDIMISDSARYAKINFVPEKYVDPADCNECGGYAVASTLATVSDEFIP
jgi:hypothetical protein